MDVNVKNQAATSALAKRAASEIEKCVHCGFCTAACPTYSIDHNELDSPRGRIYLVKRLLEDGANASTAQLHLDRCLGCRSCEPACPSGVAYSTIAHAGREIAERQNPRGTQSTLARTALVETVRNKAIGRVARMAARIAGPLAPKRLKRSMSRSPAHRIGAPKTNHGRSVVVISGCAQSGLMPETNHALARLLDAVGYETEFINTPCCGAVRMHNGRHEAAQEDMRKTAAACEFALRGGAEAVMVAASGCASFVTEYPDMLEQEDTSLPDVRMVADKVVDPASFLLRHMKDNKSLANIGAGRKIAAHIPCTLANGLRSSNAYPELMSIAGFDIVSLENPPRCCGSAGTYSLLQPRISSILRDRLVRSAEATSANELATANIGCALHARQAMSIPVNHWIDILAACVSH